MELLIAILIALGSLSSPESFTTEYQLQHQEDIEKATYIIESEEYTRNSTGGVIIDNEIDG